LKPVLFIGKDGLTEATVVALEQAFNTRELLKVKIQQAAPDLAREIGPLLAERLEGTELVQVIGRTLVLYRRDPDNPKIHLPRPESPE
jgi:RNA-binding protein